MNLQTLYVSHLHLRNPEQVAEMVCAFESGEILPPLLIVRLMDGEFQLFDGHHRATAYWLAGHRLLDWGDYWLLEQAEKDRPICGCVPDLVRWYEAILSE